MDGWTLSREYGSSQGAVRYEVFGTGPPVVLVHGTPFSSYVWRRVVPALAEKNTVYAFDLPGYGSSQMRDGQDVSLAAQGRVLSGLLDHLGLHKPAVVGHDFGGAITLRAHLLEGRDFRAIALIDAVALSPWGSPFYRLVQDHVGVFRQMPAYMHEAMVAAYVRDATYVPMDDGTLVLLELNPPYDYPANLGKMREPTSGLEPLTQSLFTSVRSVAAERCTRLHIQHSE
jgi:pimeloyl-ACP methyl ester carboxylesterase